VNITAWKLDLYRILHVFNVRPIASAWATLTAHFQTELVTNTDVAISKIRRNTIEADTMRTRTLETHTVVPVTHRTVVASQKANGNKKWSVSIVCNLPITESMLTAP